MAIKFREKLLAGETEAAKVDPAELEGISAEEEVIIENISSDDVSTVETNDTTGEEELIPTATE